MRMLTSDSVSHYQNNLFSMIFGREERIAFARILSDLIEADFIVDEDEMESFDEIKNDKEFNITLSMLSEAKTKTFAEAVKTLQALQDAGKKELIREKLYRMSLSDGTCVPLEALQIMAVKYALDGNGQVFSIPSGSSFIENMKVLYIENEDNTEANAYISKNYRAISNEFRLAGFSFVYIPQIVEDYKQIRGEYLHKVIKYMIPALEEAKVERIQQDLCSMTTLRFTHDLLFKKMGINMLASKPAFLFKIGESSVADTSGVDDMERNMFSNFLLVPIGKVSESCEGVMPKTILDFVVCLMDSYRSMVSGKLIVENQPLTKKFFYYGFHRSLFDLIAYGKERENYKLVINLMNRAKPVVLRPIDAEPEDVVEYEKDLVVDLTPQPYTLYIMMVYMSLLEEKLDWTDYVANNENRKLILDKYNAIYKMVSKGNASGEYRDKSHVSRIKKALKAHESIVTNIDLFIPDKVLSDKVVYYNVPVSADLVYVIEGPKGKEKEVRMVDSDYWNSDFWEEKS